MLNGLMMLSLVMCVATCMLKLIDLTPDYQITSYGKTYVGPLIVREHLLFAQSGQVGGYLRCNTDTTKPRPFSSFRWIPGVLFQWDRSNGMFFEFYLNFWFLLVISGALPLVWSVRAVRRRRRNARAPSGPVCYDCGYNLTGNVSGVCPECGTVIAKVIQAK